MVETYKFLTNGYDEAAVRDFLTLSRNNRTR